VSLTLSPRIYIGIDPGLSGAVVGIGENQQVVFIKKTPVFKSARKGTKYDLEAMWKLFTELKSKFKVFCAIEKSHSRPTDSRPSAWTTGCGFGFWQMALTASEIPYVIVPPKAWQAEAFASKSLGVQKTTKELSIECAKIVFPGINLLPTRRSRKPDHNISDAALISLYCKNQFGS
jgi:hypothetical protein